MNIALIIPYDINFHGGIQKHVIELAKNIVLLGHHVTLISLSSNKEAMRQDLMKDSVSFIHLPNRIIPVPTGGGTMSGISFSLSSFSHFKKIFAEHSFDIIHLHEPLVLTVCLGALSESKSVNIGTFHTYREKGMGFYFFGRFILKHWFGYLNGCIAGSKCSKDFMNRYFPADYTVIHYGVNIERFSLPYKPLSEFVDHKLNILFVGRLEKRKGFKYLLWAFGKLKKKNPNIRLIIVGSGKITRSVKKYISEQELEDIAFVGPVSDEELPRYYQIADIFCSPSIGNESFGIVLIEAMAAGKAIVASRIDGYSGVLTDGKEGFLVEPKNEIALAEALQYIIDNKGLRETMGEVGKKTADQYSWNKIATRVVAFYEQTLKEK